MSRLDEPVYLGAYWGVRLEPVEECAARLRGCLRSMALVSPLLGSWKPKGRSKQEAMSLAEIDETDLVALLGAGVNRRDLDGSPIPELGFRWSAWNGRSKGAVAVSATCGASALGVVNSFVVDLPALSSSEVDVVYSNVEALLEGIVGAWDPDWAVVTSHRLREVRDWAPGEPVVGWLTYLGPHRFPGDGVGSQMLDGTLMSAGDNWADVDTGAVDRVAAVLEAACVLFPTGQLPPGHD